MALFEGAAARAAQALAGVRPEQLDGPTPCLEWSDQQLVEHMVGSTDYLLGTAGEVARMS